MRHLIHWRKNGTALTMRCAFSINQMMIQKNIPWTSCAKMFLLTSTMLWPLKILLCSMWSAHMAFLWDICAYISRLMLTATAWYPSMCMLSTTLSADTEMPCTWNTRPRALKRYPKTIILQEFTTETASISSFRGSRGRMREGILPLPPLTLTDLKTSTTITAMTRATLP